MINSGKLKMATTRKYKERLRKQRDRQQEYRDRLKSERRPSRDDIARVVLQFVIKRFAKTMSDKDLYRFESIIAKRMQRQGFDEALTLQVFEDLIEKYVDNNWKFRRKIHLEKK